MSEKCVAEEQKTKLYEQNVKLCRAVRAQSCVYDRESPYKKNECQDNAWEIIAKECEDTVKSCKSRWRNIRTAFTRSLQPQSKKRQSYRLRDYYLYDDLIFLIPHLDTATDFSKTTDSEDDVSLVTNKSSEGTKLESTLNSRKKKTVNEDELTLSADEAATDEQKTSPTSEKTNTNKPSDQVKPIKIDSEDLVPATSQPAAATKDHEKRNFRFRRACKRSLDKNVVQQLCDTSPKKDIQPKRSRRSLIKTENNSETKTKSKSPTKEAGTPKKQRENQVILLKSAEKSPVVQLPSLENPQLPQNQKFDYDLPESIEPIKLLAPPEPLAGTCEQASQCDTVTDIWDDEFLNSLRPQMAVMNLRQKLNFKQKVYLSLMHVFDDPAKFLGPHETTSITMTPPPIENAATTGEMLLIRELVSMVQAAKSIPELVSQPTIEKVVENSYNTLPNVKAIDLTEASTSAQAEAAQKTPTWRFAEPTRPQIVRKIFKTNSDGTFTTQDSAKPRIYRILPQSTSSPFKQTTSNGNSGTFIIPRVPASIASSVNAAAAAAAAEVSEKNRVLPNKIYQQIPVSSGTLLVSDSQATAVVNSSPGVRRTVTIRNTEPPSGTFAPRQIVRRYSICGAGNNIGELAGTTNKIITTSASMMPPLHLLNSTVYSSALTPTRLVRATSTSPFKVPMTAVTSVTQALKTKTTPAAANVLSNAAPFTLSTSAVKIPIGKMGAMHNFSFKKSPTLPSISNNKTPPIPQNIKDKQVTEKQARNLSNFNAADTAGIIASDNFASFNIKNEPMD